MIHRLTTWFAQGVIYFLFLVGWGGMFFQHCHWELVMLIATTNGLWWIESEKNRRLKCMLKDQLMCRIADELNVVARRMLEEDPQYEELRQKLKSEGLNLK